jgi:polyhydroxyalkanoate synthesis regulator protein
MSIMPRKHQRVAAEPMLIKRYAGRRLYNTATLAYTTPAELRAIADRGQRLIIRDAPSGDDVTREILARN